MNPPDIGGASKAASDNVAQAVSSGIDSAKDTLTSRKKGQSETSPNETTEAAAPADSDAEKKASEDWTGASREKGPSPLGTCLFIFLRLADVWFQYALIAHEVMPTLMSYLPIGLHSPRSSCTSTTISLTSLPPGGYVVTHRLADPSSTTLGLGLTDYHLTLVGLAFASALKQIIWILFISEQKMPPRFVLTICGFNTFLNTLNTFFALYSRTSGVIPQTFEFGGYLKQAVQYAVPMGQSLFAAGLAIELISEVQRKVWKGRPENKGKPFGGGLFRKATNINYGGYTLWRAGYACYAGKLGWGGLTGMLIGTDFVRRAIPSMDRYCEEKVSAELRDRTLGLLTR